RGKVLWVKGFRRSRPLGVQHEDGAPAAHQWGKPMMHATEIESLEAAANNGSFQFHDAPGPPRSSTIPQRRLSKNFCKPVAYPIEIGANSVAIASGYGSLHSLSRLPRPERDGTQR